MIKYCRVLLQKQMKDVSCRVEKFMEIVSFIKYAGTVMFLTLCLEFHVNRKCH
jgi:hypothetical protein